MKRFSKIRPGLLVPTGPAGFRSIASRRSTRPLLPKEVIELTILRVHGDDVAALQVDEPAVGSIGTLPVVHPARARGRRAFLAPDLLAGRRIDRGERAAPDRGVHHAVDDDGIEDAVAGDGKAPGHLRASPRSSC